MEELLSKLNSEGNLRELKSTACYGKYIEYDGRRYVNMSSNDYLGIGATDLQGRFAKWLMDNADTWLGTEAMGGGEAIWNGEGDDDTMIDLFGIPSGGNGAPLPCGHGSTVIPAASRGGSARRSSDRGHSARLLMSNPSSRLMTGNSPEYALLEGALSGMFGGRAALVLGSGYHANTGILPAIASKGDLIIADKLVHASLIDALRLSDADHLRFAHNDMGHLEKLITVNRDKYRDIWVVTESVFSMDGDRADLQALYDLKNKYGVKLYLDEAHAFGVFGPSGTGLAAAEGLTDTFDIIICTFGKAMASVGAAVICNPLTKEVLVNRMRPLIFSTALPPVSLMWTLFLLENQTVLDERRRRLKEIIKDLDNSPSATQIMPVMAGENHAAIDMARKFVDEGFWVTPVRYPTVPQGAARVRVSLSAALDDEDISKFKALCGRIG